MHSSILLFLFPFFLANINTSISILLAGAAIMVQMMISGVTWSLMLLFRSFSMSKGKKQILLFGWVPLGADESPGLPPHPCPGTQGSEPGAQRTHLPHSSPDKTANEHSLSYRSPSAWRAAETTYFNILLAGCGDWLCISSVRWSCCRSALHVGWCNAVVYHPSSQVDAFCFRQPSFH